MELSGFAIIVYHLDLSQSSAAIVYSAYSLCLVVCLPISGWLIDIGHIARSFRLGVFLYALSSLAMLAEYGFFYILACRCVQGFSAGLFSPSVPIIVSNSGASSARSLSIWTTISSVLFAISPLIIGYMTEYASWGAAWLLIPLFALFALCMVKDLNQTDLGVVRYRVPSTESLIILLVIFLCFGASTFVIFALPTDFRTPSEAGFALMLLWILSGAVSFFISKLLSNNNYRALIFIGFVLHFPIVPAVMFGEPYVAVTLAGLGMGLVNAPTTFALLRSARANEQGLLASLDIMSARLGGSIFIIAFAV
ncbi:MFS transporter [Pontivivens ytuae]|uniref:MFS transporter n=1 Tax=Pontivivens ytuae TaxID=2789856 RepID=A0A7S9QD13_9RHOB|nr:MFS transporter [Pontivivens ytuae]QPH54503.1 MFS transporter [Pontivivens ytuae]